MKKIIYISLFLIGMFTLFSDDLRENTVTLTVKVVNIKNDKGSILAALCDSKESYDNSDMFMGRMEPIINKQSIIIFENIPSGEYAIQLFHDKNNNGELDTGLFGIPKEDYAFSNNIPGPLGPPDYEKVKFLVTEDVYIEIQLN